MSLKLVNNQKNEYKGLHFLSLYKDIIWKE